MELHELIDAVRDFQRAAGQPAPADPVPLDADRRRRRAAWMAEEVQEFLDSDELTDQVDAMVDLLYFLAGTLVEMGLDDLSAEFALVHAANLTKVADRASRVDAPDGKVEKPPGWVDPRVQLAGLLTRSLTGRRLVCGDTGDRIGAALAMALDHLGSPVPLAEAVAAVAGATDLAGAIAAVGVAATAGRVPAGAGDGVAFAGELAAACATGAAVVTAGPGAGAADLPVPTAVVVESVSGSSARLLDPGPGTEGLRWCDVELLRAAVADGAAEVWRVDAATR